MIKRLILVIITILSLLNFAGTKFYCEKESNYLECDDGNLYNGYYWREFWVPGLPTYKSQMLVNPPIVVGKAVFYAPNVMEATAKFRGIKVTREYVGAVSLLTCGDIGKPVWIKRPQHNWEGPFLVVDCAKRGDLYGIINYNKEAVEVDFDTALRWKMVSFNEKGSYEYSVNEWFISNVKVSKYKPELTEYFDEIRMDTWFNSVVKYTTIELEKNVCNKVRYRPPELVGELPMWRIDCKWSKLNESPFVVRKGDIIYK